MDAKISREFKWTDSSEYGEGFAPSHIPQADPCFSGMTAAHDVLEHIFDTAGGFEGEMQALGAVYVVRQYRQFMYRYTQYESTASDIQNFLRNLQWGGQTLKDPGEVELIEDEEFSSQEALIHIRKAIVEFCKEYTQGQIPGAYNLMADARRGLPKNADMLILKWMNKGVALARKHSKLYGIRQHHWEDLFRTIEQEWDKRVKHADSYHTIRVEVDFEKIQARLIIDEPEPEYEEEDDEFETETE